MIRQVFYHCVTTFDSNKTSLLTNATFLPKIWLVIFIDKMTGLTSIRAMFVLYYKTV